MIFHRSLVHPIDPYAGFNAAAYPLDLAGWHGQYPIFAELVNELRPALTIEVGSWKGMSSATLGHALQKTGGHLLCVDTWLGSAEMWTNRGKDYHPSLRLQYGHPTVYSQWMANMIHECLTETVTPFPLSSTAAAEALKHWEVTANLVYLDASHSEADVLADLAAWWPLVESGGVLFGDDYNAAWPGVKKAVDAFFGVGCVDVRPPFWIVRK